MTRIETRVFGCWIPTSMIDDPPVWQAFWAYQASRHGQEPAGEPTLIERIPRFDRFDHRDEERQRAIEALRRWTAEGPVQAADQTDSTAARNDSSGTAV
jgi:hypothetical protein